MKRCFSILPILLSSGLEVMLGCGGKGVVDLNIQDWSIEYESERSIKTVRPDGEGEQSIGTIPEVMTARYFTGRRCPLGNRWVFASTRGGDAEIWTCGLEGQDPKQLTDNDCIDNIPEWSPDGKKIMFSSTRTGNWQVWTMDADGRNAARITNQQKGAREAKYADDGKRIAYRSIREEAPRTSFDLMVADYSGSNETMIASEDDIVDFAWIGSSIVYGALGELRIVDSLTGIVSKTFRFGRIDKRFKSYGAHEITVRPDKKAIACVVGFRGSTTGGYEPPKELLSVPVDGCEADVKRVALSGEIHLLRWVSTK